jgi:sodium/proline symporter
MVGMVFAPILMGLLYSALMAAIMSTADSQLLVASAAVTNDLYSLSKNKKRTQENMVWISRLVVVVVAIIAALLALNKNGSIMDLVSYAWAGFGAAFGPVVLLSLFWKRSNGKGALAAMIVGFLTIVLWDTCFTAGGLIGGGAYCIYNTGIYELLPGFIFGLIAMIVVSLLTEAPTQEMCDEFDEVMAETNSKS